MKRKLVWVVTLFIVITIHGITQSILTIQTNKSECSDTLILYNWQHGKQKEILKTNMSVGFASITVPEGVSPGMLQVNFRGSCFFFNYMLVFNGNDLSLKVNADDNNNIGFQDSGENPLFNSFNHLIDSLNTRIMKLIELKSVFSDDPEFQKETNRHLEHALNDRKTLFNELRSLYADHFFSHFLYYKDYYIPDQSKSPSEQRKEMVDHFYDHFDPLDTLLLNSTVYEDMVLDYLNLANGIAGENNEAGFILMIDCFLKRLNNSEVLIKSSIDLMQPWLKEKGYDMTLEYLDQQYLAVQCGSGSDNDLQKRLAAYERTKIGRNAPDLNWASTDSVIHHLPDIQSSLTLLIFWASWCPHCKEELPELYNKLKMRQDVTVITIGLDPDETLWKEAIARFPKWINLRAPEKWNNKWIVDWGVYGTPTFFLLNADKKILGKSPQSKPVINMIEK